MTDKLTFSFKGPVTVRIGNSVVDLEKHATTFEYEGRAAGKSDQLKGFDAGNGTFFRLKKKPDGAVDVIVYGKPESLAKYQFKVGNGDLSKARFAGAGEFRSAAPQARDFSINAGDLAAASRDQLLDRLKLAQHVKTPPAPHSPPSKSANATVQTSVNKPSGAPPHAQQSASLEIEERGPARPARRNPAVGFKNLGNTCYLNSTLKTLFASTREATLESLKAQAGKPPFTIAVGGRKILDEIRIQLIALGEAADDPGKQALVDTALAKLVSLLDHADMSKVCEFASGEIKQLNERENPTLLPFSEAESHLDVVRAARRLAREGKSYQDVLSSAFVAPNAKIAAQIAASYADTKSLDWLLEKAEKSYGWLKTAHDEVRGRLNSEARSKGWASFEDQKDALAWMSASHKFVQKIKSQNDAPEFGAWLNGIMRISPAAEGRFYIKTQIENVWKETQVGTSSRPAESVLQLTPPKALQNNANLTALIQQPLKAEQVELAAAGGKATKRSVIEADLSALTRFAVRIDANDAFGTPVALTGIDFDAEVIVPMTDQKTRKLNNVVMRPAEVIFREEYNSQNAHYYAYLRNGDRWDQHNDSVLTHGSALPQLSAGLQPRVIVMEVLRTEPVK